MENQIKHQNLPPEEQDRGARHKGTGGHPYKWRKLSKLQVKMLARERKGKEGKERKERRQKKLIELHQSSHITPIRRPEYVERDPPPPPSQQKEG
jgi:hypothetical protein